MVTNHDRIVECVRIIVDEFVDNFRVGVVDESPSTLPIIKIVKWEVRFARYSTIIKHSPLGRVLISNFEDVEWRIIVLYAFTVSEKCYATRIFLVY